MDLGIDGRFKKVDSDAVISRGNEEPSEDVISEFRAVLPQVFASSAQNILMLDLGMTIAYPTVAIPELLQSSDGLSFTMEQASWFGSLAFIVQPLGSLISGFLFEPLGRRRSLLLVSFPRVVGWLLIYFATDVIHLYSAVIILGAGIGFMEAPVVTYVGEISQPKWRGLLAAYAGISVGLGILLVNFFGALSDWRMTAALCSSLPMLAFFALLHVPESPVWLVAKGRVKDAEKSLCWLRGWVQPNSVQKELYHMIEHNTLHKRKISVGIKTISSVIDGQEGAGVQVNKTVEKSACEKMVEGMKIDYLFRREMMQPFFLICVFFVLHHGSGVTSTRPFIVEIFKSYGTSWDGQWITVITCGVSILANVFGMLLLRFYGKKKLTMISATLCTLANASLWFYGVFYLTSNLSWVPVTLIIVLNFGWSFGIGQIPWMLMSEIFPFRGRGVATGAAAAVSNILGFLFIKYFLNIQESVTLPGSFGIFGVITFLGLLFLHFFLPETEGKTMLEIEELLADKFDKIMRRRRHTIV